MWAVTKSVFTDFLGWHYPSESKWAVPVSTTECEEMRDLRKCKNETMYLKGAHKYAYDVMPPLQPVWMTKRQVSTFHCKIAEVALENECDNCTINSPIGSIEYPYNGTVTRSHQTLIWEDAYKEQKPCDLKIVGESVQTVSPLTVDIHSNGSYDGIDARNVTDSKVPSSLAAEIQQAAHHQFTRDEAMDQINRLAGEIRRLQCENRKSTRNSILLSAQNDEWYAATQLHLPPCSRLRVYGAQVEVSRCVPFNVTFGAERTKCGYQPRFMNYTLAHNGWQLVQYHPCYWPDGNYVNFNGKTHIHADGAWVPVITSVPVNNRQLVEFATYQADNSLQNFLQMNPAMQNGPLSHESVMADILATIHQHYAEDNSRQLLTANVLIQHSAAPNIDFVTKMGGWVKNFGAVSGLGALSVLAVRFCGIGSLILKAFPLLSKLLQCVCSKKSQKAITALPLPIIMPPTTATHPLQPTPISTTAAPPRRTRPRQPRQPHTTPEGEVFLPRRSRSQPRRVE